jgi:hypothetical protein
MGLTAALAMPVIAQSTDKPIPPDPTEKPQVTKDRDVTTMTLEQRIFNGWAARPIGADELTATVPLSTLQMYQDAGFKDDMRAIDAVTSHAPGTAAKLDEPINDSLTSLRWNLPPGVVVVMYEDATGKGEQLALWGSGEVRTLSRYDFNDKASSWAWYYAGGAKDVSQEYQPAAIVFPNGTVVIASGTPQIAPATMLLYSNKGFEGDATPLTDVTMHPAGQLNKVPPGMNDKITSLRWNLPPGVVVTFYQDADGMKQQASVWGNGEVTNVDAWDMNDKISRWSWNYIGSREGDVLGYTPPGHTTIVVPAAPAVGVDHDAIDLVSKAMIENKLGVSANDLRAMKNPTGEGTFVFVPQTTFEGVQRRVVWIVVNDKAYALSGPAKMITPTLLTPADADEIIWSRTGLNQQHAEDDAAKIVFPHG